MSALPHPGLDRVLQNITLVGQPDKSKEALETHLRDILSRHPLLQQQMSQAVDQGDLQHIRISGKLGAPIQYEQDKKTIQLNELKIPNDVNKEGSFVFILAHETEHGPNHRVYGPAHTQFYTDIALDRKQQGTHRDYTASIDKVLNATRKDEASAHIAGWNALVDHVKQQGKDLDLSNLYNASPEYAKDFIERTRELSSPRNYEYKLREGLTLNADFTLTDTDENIDAVGTHYFDVPSEKMDKTERLDGHTDYRNLYAAPYVAAICRQELDHPKAGGKALIDFERLGLQPDQLRGVGLDLGKHTGQTCTLYDAQRPDEPLLFQGRVPKPAKTPAQPAPSAEAPPSTGLTGQPHSQAPSTASPEAIQTVEALHEKLQANIGQQIEAAGAGRFAENMVAECTYQCIQHGITAKNIKLMFVNTDRNKILMESKSADLVIVDAFEAAKADPAERLQAAVQVQEEKVQERAQQQEQQQLVQQQGRMGPRLG